MSEAPTVSRRLMNEVVEQAVQNRGWDNAYPKLSELVPAMLQTSFDNELRRALRSVYAAGVQEGYAQALRIEDAAS